LEERTIFNDMIKNTLAIRIKAILRLLIPFREYGIHLIKYVKDLVCFFKTYLSYSRSNKNSNFEYSFDFLYPCLRDKTEFTIIEPTYFFQDSWAANKVFRLNPQHHFDVGSSVKTIGIISQFVPTTMVDIRPPQISLPGLSFVKGSITNLPFKDSSIESLSSLCVIEHIGLGRYGDPIDHWGSESAASELKRVLRCGGVLIISVPVDDKCRIYYNAHRAFTRDYVLQLFADLILVEELYVYGAELHANFEPRLGFGTALYQFKKQ
jgi:SAM-dependent methyltransferase